MDVMERWVPTVMDSALQVLPATEKAAVQAATVDLQWIVDRTSTVWTGGEHYMFLLYFF